MRLKGIGEEQEAFEQVLEHYLACRQLKNPRILDICCGIANEEPLLRQHFGSNVEIVGLDNDESRRELAEELGRKSVTTGDLRDIRDYVSGKFGLVIGRNVPLNPNYDDSKRRLLDYWPQVFEDLTQFMSSGSTLFLTLLREDEFYRAGEILNELEYRIGIKEKNPIIVPTDGIGVRGDDTKDHYIILAQLPSQLQLRLSYFSDAN